MILVGNSLSFCVGQLLDGTQTWAEGQKLVIVACTACPSLEVAYANYGHSYWQGHAKEVVMALLERLWPHVVQPRLYRSRYVHSANSPNWFVTETLNPREITNRIIEIEESEGRTSLFETVPRSDLLDLVHADIARAIEAP